MGKHPDQLLPGFCFLLLQYGLDILDGHQVYHLVLDLNRGCINGQLQDIVFILHFDQLVLAGFNIQQGVNQFSTECLQCLDIFNGSHLEELFRGFVDQLNTPVSRISDYADVYILHDGLQVMKILFFLGPHFLKVFHHLIKGLIEFIECAPHAFHVKGPGEFGKTHRFQKTRQFPVGFVKEPDQRTDLENDQHACDDGCNEIFDLQGIKEKKDACSQQDNPEYNIDPVIFKNHIFPFSGITKCG